MKTAVNWNRILRLCGGIAAGLVLVWFLLPFLVAGILNIGNATGIVLAFLLLMYFVFQPRIHIWARIAWKNGIYRGLMCSVVALAVVIALLALIETGLIVKANLMQPKADATVVVLGCRVYGERASLSLVERLEAAYEYLEANPEAVCVVSGGKGDGENISEAECMYRWLVERGIDKERIYKEDQSTSTEENLAFSKAVIEANGLSSDIAIVTSEYHCYRAGLQAEANGLSYGTVPGHTALWLLPTFYVRELYGILEAWVF